MLIYLDAMIAQYIADNVDYVLWIGGYLPQDAVDPNSLPSGDQKLLVELYALGQLTFLEQLGSDWCYAATLHLMQELRAGRPKPRQTDYYDILESVWQDSGWMEAFPLDPERVATVERALSPLHLKEADTLHLAQAIVLGASWFLTNDSEIVENCRDAKLPLRVCRPSECLEGLSVGLFLCTEAQQAQQLNACEPTGIACHELPSAYPHQLF